MSRGFQTKFTGALRYEVLSRLRRAQDGRCAYCCVFKTTKRLTLDHVMPVGAGGLDEVENLLAVCEPCNSGKSGELPTLEFHEAIRRAVHAKIDWREPLMAAA